MVLSETEWDDLSILFLYFAFDEFLHLPSYLSFVLDISKVYPT